MALEAEIVLAGPEGERRLPAEDYYQGLYETARRSEELLVQVRFPVQRAAQAVGFDELARRHGDFAIVGLAVRAEVDDGRFAEARLVFFGSEARPAPAETAAAALRGQAWNAATAEAVSAALARDLDPMESLEGGPAFKLQLARVLAKRVLGRLAA